MSSQPVSTTAVAEKHQPPHLKDGVLKYASLMFCFACVFYFSRLFVRCGADDGNYCLRADLMICAGCEYSMQQHLPIVLLTAFGTNVPIMY